MQGLGAGGIIPLSMTIVGELYTLAERSRTQALFSSVWGVASVAGPLVGGYLTDALSWRWVFYINIPFGLLCIGVISAAYPASAMVRRVRVDWLGAALLFAGVSALLVALGGDAPLVPWLAGAIVLLGLFAFVQMRVAEPILPLEVLRYPVMSRTLGVVFLDRLRPLRRRRLRAALRAGRAGRHGHAGRAGADAPVPRLGGDVGARAQRPP